MKQTHIQTALALAGYDLATPVVKSRIETRETVDYLIILVDLGIAGVKKYAIPMAQVMERENEMKSSPTKEQEPTPATEQPAKPRAKPKK